MAADKISITFDENNQIRILESNIYNDCLSLQTESYDFISKMKQFQDIVGSLVDVLDTHASKIEQEKLRAVGLRNQVDSEPEARKKKQQELQFLINEKLAELERYTYQLESLQKVEEEQRMLIEKLRNNEA
jgi:intraflagellar transport protein 20